MIIINNFFFNRSVTKYELLFLRIVLALAVILPICFGQYNRFLFDASPFLLQQNNWLTNFFFSNLLIYDSLRWIAVGSSILFALGKRTLYSGLLTSVSFTLLDYLSFAIESTIWNYMTHIQFFIFLLSFSGLNHRELTSFIFRVMQVYVCMIYFQAGLSKVIHGGLPWIKTGSALFVTTFLDGTPMSKMLLPYERLFILISCATVIFELMVPIIFINPKRRRFLGFSLITFHLGTYYWFNISFWQLFMLYPVLLMNEHHKVELHAPTCNRPPLST
jgi:hypothetical protein